jgi:hypothetical protein
MRSFLAVILTLASLPWALGAQRRADAELLGSVVAAGTGEAIAGAWVALEDREFGTYSRRDGRFRLPDVPLAPRSYDVEALGYLPVTVTLDPGATDTVVELSPDEALAPGLDFLFEHLASRRRGGRVFDRQALSFSGAYDLSELLRTRGVRNIRRFCLDERWVPGLGSEPPEGFYMMEIHRGTARLYTEEFLEELAAAGSDEIVRVIRKEQPAC